MSKSFILLILLVALLNSQTIRIPSNIISVLNTTNNTTTTNSTALATPLINSSINLIKNISVFRTQAGFLYHGTVDIQIS